MIIASCDAQNLSHWSYLPCDAQNLSHWSYLPLSPMYKIMKKIYINQSSKQFIWNLQQMTRVVKASFVAWNWPYRIISTAQEAT